MTQLKRLPMDIHFNYVHVSASETLENFTREKLNKLKNHYDFIVSADVYFKTENTSSPEKGKICDIQINLPGPEIFISANEANFEKAVYSNIADLKRQLRKRKERMQAH